VQVWVSADSLKNVAGIASALEKACEASGSKDLRAFVVFINHLEQPGDEIGKELAAWAEKNGWKRVSVAYLAGPNARPVSDFKISLDVRVRNTVFLYRDRMLRDRFINLKADEKGIAALQASIAELLK